MPLAWSAACPPVARLSRLAIEGPGTVGQWQESRPRRTPPTARGQQLGWQRASVSSELQMSLRVTLNPSAFNKLSGGAVACNLTRNKQSSSGLNRPKSDLNRTHPTVGRCSNINCRTPNHAHPNPEYARVVCVVLQVAVLRSTHNTAGPASRPLAPQTSPSKTAFQNNPINYSRGSTINYSRGSTIRLDIEFLTPRKGRPLMAAP